jgi:hypothetical protein
MVSRVLESAVTNSSQPYSSTTKTTAEQNGTFPLKDLNEDDDVDVDEFSSSDTETCFSVSAPDNSNAILLW